MNKRPPWPVRMMMLANFWRQFSTCLHRQCGAVIYRSGTWQVLALGYNDTPQGAVNCGDGGCEPCKESESASLKIDCRCVHAEMNALMAAARNGIAVDGAMIAVDGSYAICQSCQKHLTQAGVSWGKLE